MTVIQGYHAHVYCRPGQRAQAARVREAVADRFPVRLGRWHETPVGPHPVGMYQLAFEPAVFSELVPWLMIHRDGLSVLVHPETGDDLSDHRDHALWLGDPMPLRLEVFSTD